MELLQTARDRRQLETTQRFVRDMAFTVLPLTQDIGHRALVYVEQHTLASGLRAGDALIAATAVEHGLGLATANAKHFRPIAGLQLQVFRP
jgi:predicted nucleic acid-binding protein